LRAGDVAAPRGRSPTGVGLLIGSGALAATAIATGAWYLSARSTVDAHCTHDHVCDDAGFNAAGQASSLAKATTAFWITAAVAGGVGTYLLLRRPVQVMPAWQRGGATLTAQVGF
jgi:hypothetical protein